MTVSGLSRIYIPQSEFRNHTSPFRSVALLVYCSAAVLPHSPKLPSAFGKGLGVRAIRPLVLHRTASLLLFLQQSPAACVRRSRSDVATVDYFPTAPFLLQPKAPHKIALQICYTRFCINSVPIAKLLGCGLSDRSKHIIVKSEPHVGLYIN